MKPVKHYHQAGLFLRFILIAVVIFLASSPRLAAATVVGGHRYVDPAGTDSGDCSLISSPCLTVQYAINQSANYNDTIHIAAGTYPNTHLIVSKFLTFSGAGRDTTILDGSGTGKVVYLNTLITASFSDLTIRNGANYSGAGITNVFSSAALELARVKVTDNVAHIGAGIMSYGPLTITDSVIANNSADLDPMPGDWGFGGALYLHSEGVSTTLSNVTISGNTSSGYGAGIQCEADNTTGGQLTLTNVTISNNTAKYDAAGRITNTCHAAIINSTISDNHIEAWPGANTGGLAIYGVTIIQNTIIANNQDTNCTIGPDSTWTSMGNNIDSASTCQFNNSLKNDRQNTNPLLLPLSNNGGSIETIALQSGSPAINRVVYNPPDGCPLIDARGISRPFGFFCDIGAYESQDLYYWITFPIIFK